MFSIIINLQPNFLPYIAKDNYFQNTQKNKKKMCSTQNKKKKKKDQLYLTLNPLYNCRREIKFIPIFLDFSYI